MNNINKRILKDSYKATYYVTSVNSYLEALKDIKKIERNNILWYRGQNNLNWDLSPNLFRKSRRLSESGKLEKSFSIKTHYQSIYPNSYEELKLLKNEISRNKALKELSVKNDFELMYLGQHYQMLTPLVDFTTDPLMALFFALDGLNKIECLKQQNDCLDDYIHDRYFNEAAAVYILLPEVLNNNSQFKYDDGSDLGLVEIDENNYKKFESYVTRSNTPLTPICLITPKDDYRIVRQSGNFVCYGDRMDPINIYPNKNEFLYQIIIPYTVLTEFQEFLELINITSKTVYGEEDRFQGFGKTVAEEIYKLFKESLIDYQ